MILVGIGGFLTGAELWRVRAVWARGGLLDARISLHGRAIVPGVSLPTGITPKVALAVAVASVSLIAATALDLSLVRFVALSLVAIGLVLLASTMKYGRDGADEMALIVTLPIALAAVSGFDDAIVELAFWFIALQLSLSYFIAGSYKLRGKHWIDGSAMARIASTRSYGHVRFGRAIRTNTVAGMVITWGVVAWEIAFPFAMILGAEIGLFFLAIACLFHVANSIIMGLNRFLPWWLAAYPATAFITWHFGLLA